MALLICSLSYLIGIALGRALWNMGLLDCATPAWLWPIPLALLPLTALLQRAAGAPATAMVWPQSAGFRPPHRAMQPALLAAVVCCLAAGALRYAAAPLTPCWTPQDLAYYNLPADRAYDRGAPSVTVQGFVSSYPLTSDTKQRVEITVDAITAAGSLHPVTGTLRLNTGTRTRYVYGQPVRVRGRLVTPPDFEDFSYREYLARKGIHSLMYGAEIDVLSAPVAGSAVLRALYAFRARGEALLNRQLPEPYAALANGMLLGIEAGIPDDLYDQFNLTGTSHVIVISGSNVALIAGVLLALGTRIFGRRYAVIPALLGIVAFALLVGGDAAVMRAALMGGLFVYATSIGRRSTALVSLALACWIMTLANPLTLWDVGFQLSSAATAGLILFSPMVTETFGRIFPGMGGPLTQPTGPAAPTDLVSHGKTAFRGLIEDGLLITIAANITTLPLVVYYFGRLSVVSLLTNVLIAPVQSFIMLGGTLGVILGVAGAPWLSQLILIVPWISLVWTVAMVRWTAALPGASLDIAGYGSGALAATYLLLGLTVTRGSLTAWGRAFLSNGVAAAGRRLASPLALGVGGVGCVVVWMLALSQPDGRLHVHFLDIGQGDGIFIQTPSGRQVLIDGGASPQALFSELGAVMPSWDRSIDVLLLTHPDGDHMGAQIDVPARFDVGRGLDTAVSQANPDAAPWRDALARAGAPVHLQHTGGMVDLGDGVALWVLWPPPDGFAHEHADNENSLVVKLVYGEFSVLLTGDAGLPSEEVWVRQGLPLQASVLKVGHHGSNSATGPAFVQAVDPALAVIQVGADNDYGHPTDDVLATLSGRTVLRNDQHGRVHVWSDGRQIWMETERNAHLVQASVQPVDPR